MSSAYTSGFGFPADVLFDVGRARRVLSNKWFFVGTRGDVRQPRDYFTFDVLGDEFMLLHGSDGRIRCFVNRCAHQSARVVRNETGTCAASLVCPNHQWTYNIDSGSLRAAPMMGKSFMDTDVARMASLTEIPLREVAGLLFACLDDETSGSDLDEIDAIISPYTDPFALEEGRYKLAYHHREVVPASWLSVMINNRECCHCRQNHKGLLNLFDPSSFNGATSARYDEMFARGVARWETMGREWKEQAFEPNDCCRIARYPLEEGFESITFDGKRASNKLIGGWEAYDASTLSMWLNPNVWIHFTSDHIATNWVLPIDGETCTMYSSWIVHEDAVEGQDYDVAHLTDVWKVTNAEDVELCNSMTRGARSSYYEPGPFSDDERFCIQFCDWYMRYSE
ncbi:MAG: Rieske 2Fe-2S family protein [Verrucomicrobiales bacterium]